MVGGTAEEFWTADEYHETDLDLCVPLDLQGEQALRAMGFQKEGRHWVRDGLPVAVEIPASSIDGDESRTWTESIAGGSARIIGVDDLYLDRLRQATLNEAAEDVHFHSTLAVASACYDQIDWDYVRRRVAEIARSDRLVGDSMRRLDSKIRRRVRRRLSGPPH